MSTQSRAHRKPPDVEEALSSMLWTPYDNNLSESDSSDEPDAVLQRLSNNATGYSFFGTGPNHDHRRRQQQSLMRRSLSAWSYRARASGKPSAGELQAGNRFSYPYYDHTELGVGSLGGWDGGFGNNNHVNGNGSYDSYGYDHAVTGSSYSIHGATAPQHRAPWQTVQPQSGSTEKRPYLQLQTPFVGRWHRVPVTQDGGSGATPLETSSLPFSLLALDNPPASCVLPGSRSTDGDGFADSYRDDYQVYPAGGKGEPFGGPRNGNNSNHSSIGHDGTCSKSLNNGSGDSSEQQHSGNSLCMISAMLNPNAHPGDSSGNGGDLHFSANNQHYHHHQQQQQQHPMPPSSGAVQLHHRWLHRKSASTCLVVANDGTHTVDGRPGQVPIARTPSQRRAEEVGEKEIDESTTVVSHTAGSNARQAHGEASSSPSSSLLVSLPLLTVGGAQNDRAARAASVANGVAVASAGAGEEEEEEGSSRRSVPEEAPRASAMRLNVPAAGLAEGSRTSVYIPSFSCLSAASTSPHSSASPSSSSSSSSSPCSGADGGLQALTIQVNRLDPNNQQQNDVVNNPSSGVSIVSCYRSAAASASAASVSGGADGGTSAPDSVGGVVVGGVVKPGQPLVNGRKGSVCADNGASGVGGSHAADNGERRRRASVGVGVGEGGGSVVESSAVDIGVVNSSPEQMVQVSSGEGGARDGAGGASQAAIGRWDGVAPSARTYTSTEAQTDDPIQVLQQPQPLQQAPTLHAAPASSQAGATGARGPYGGSPGPEVPCATTMLGGMHVGGLLMGGSPPPLVGGVGMPPGGSEFSTREHRRRERRERRQARNRLQHIHPLEPPPPPGPPGLHHRSPPPIEIIPDILHSHLPPPYTTLPMGASLIPQMIPANAAAAAAAAVAAASAIPVRAADDCRYTFPIPIMRSSPSERSRKGCCGHWFAGPPLRALIAVVALGGVACALGGAALGATGLAGSPTSHLTAALLMIGVGVILVTVSGAAWRMTAPGAPPCLGLGSTVDLGRCSRRPCGRGGSTPHGLLYPEFQHRPPPPSYQASMQEYRLRLLLLDRDRQSGRMRSTASPPPTYRSNVGSLLRIPLSSRYNNGSSNSIFGGISGIISGAVGSSSSSSVNNVPPGADPQVNSSPNGPPEHPPNPYADGHSTLPPSYRSVHLGVETLQRHSPSSPQAQPMCTTNVGGGGSSSSRSSSSSTAERVGQSSDDNIAPNGAATPSSVPSAVPAKHHTPSIIKIDDRRHSMVPSTEGIGTPGSSVEMAARRRSSVPGASLIDTREEGPPARNDGNGGNSGSINGNGSSRPCPVGAGEQPNSTTNAAATYTSGSLAGAKDLVTIVTISGTIEPSSNGSGKAVYTTSNGCGGASTASSTGATCTLLNSNSTPLLATVIPVSKSTSGGPL